jgi:hypothetical protein
MLTLQRLAHILAHRELTGIIDKGQQGANA